MSSVLEGGGEGRSQGEDEKGGRKVPRAGGVGRGGVSSGVDGLGRCILCCGSDGRDDTQ